jgi:hypothetical protein
MSKQHSRPPNSHRLQCPMARTILTTPPARRAVASAGQPGPSQGGMSIPRPRAPLTGQQYFLHVRKMGRFGEAGQPGRNRAGLLTVAATARLPPGGGASTATGVIGGGWQHTRWKGVVGGGRGGGSLTPEPLRAAIVALSPALPSPPLSASSRTGAASTRQAVLY